MQGFNFFFVQCMVATIDTMAQIAFKQYDPYDIKDVLFYHN